MSAIIANYQVQNILRAYGQQAGERSRLSKARLQKNMIQNNDQVNLSSESKKRLIADKVTPEIVTQFTNGSAADETSKEILKRLSQEYGKPLEIEIMDGRGLVFKTAGEGQEQKGQYLPPPESEKLKGKLFDIAHSIVYSNLT